MVFKALKLLPSLFVQGLHKLISAPANFLHSTVSTLVKLPGMLFAAVKSLIP